ncbi:MAG: DUF5329 family protein [Steroidobacteraceae bacterium]
MRFLCPALALTGVVAFALAGDLASVENQKIEFVIDAIGTLRNAQSVRNGTAYDAQAAADHLRLKLKNAGARVKTAEDFIRYCATDSSVSGKPHLIRYSDGRVMTSEAFLRQKLSEFHKAPGAGAKLQADPAAAARATLAFAREAK